MSHNSIVSASPEFFLDLLQTALIGRSTSYRPEGYKCALAKARATGQNLAEQAHVHALLWLEYAEIKELVKSNSRNPDALAVAKRNLDRHPFYFQADRAGCVGDTALLRANEAANLLGISPSAVQKDIDRGNVSGAKQLPHVNGNFKGGTWFVPMEYVRIKQEKCANRAKKRRNM
jgi:hypothetical protein